MPQIILASKSLGRQKVLKDLGLKFKVIPANIDERKVKASSPFLLVKKLAKLKATKTLKNLGPRTKNQELSLARRDLARLNGSKDIIIIAADSLAIIATKRVKNKILQQKLAKYRLGNYYLLGKPTSKTEAITFLSTLSDNIHYFITGLCIIEVPPKSTTPKSLRSPTKQSVVGRSGINTKDKSIYQSITKTKLWFNKLTKEQIAKHLATIPYLEHAGAYNIAKETKEVKLVKKFEGSYTNIIGLPKEEIRKFI